MTRRRRRTRSYGRLVRVSEPGAAIEVWVYEFSPGERDAFTLPPGVWPLRREPPASPTWWERALAWLRRPA